MERGRLEMLLCLCEEDRSENLEKGGVLGKNAGHPFLWHRQERGKWVDIANLKFREEDK